MTQDVLWRKMDKAVLGIAFVAYVFVVTGGGFQAPLALSTTTAMDPHPPVIDAPFSSTELHELSAARFEEIIGQMDVEKLRKHHETIRVPPPSEFVNFETPTVHPIALSPDGQTLAVCNLPDNRVLLFDVSSSTPVEQAAIPVGMDPVTVRFRTNDELWVVNHLSDSISVVDLPQRRVRRIVATGDEPCDVVFAGTGAQRAFVTCSQINTVQVFDAANPTDPIKSIELFAEDPRALAVSPDGRFVYAAVFESGNATTILMGINDLGTDNINAFVFPPNSVSNPHTPYGGVNPPPNSEGGFAPAMAPGLPPPPNVGLIVRKDDENRWRDDNGTDWTPYISGEYAHLTGRVPGWDMPDYDVAVIDAGTLELDYISRFMNICADVAVNPASGDVFVVGTEATNEVRFEPNVNGTYVRSHISRASRTDERAASIQDLNPHLDYSVPTVPMAERERSLGDPRSIAWNADGSRGYVCGLGSNNVVPVGPNGERAGEAIEVGAGPSGLAVDDAAGRMYVLNRFDASISVVDLTSETETARVAFFDPTPEAIKNGRKHLYDSHATSGLGQVSCASCHVDGRSDRLAWDLGDPTGDMISRAPQNLGFGVEELISGFINEEMHPMKGPMVTQTLQDIIGKEPFHWRGDREGIEDFNIAYEALMGAERQLNQTEMQELERFLATIHFPPNPNRGLDNSLPTDLPLDDHYTPGRFGPEGLPLPNGNAERGLELYRNPERKLGGQGSCAFCHVPPTGMSTAWRWSGSKFEFQGQTENGAFKHGIAPTGGTSLGGFKTPQIRNMHERTGFHLTKQQSRAGFGYTNDGAIDSIERFVSIRAFSVQSVQEVADLTALVLAYSGSDFPFDPNEPPGTVSLDAHAAVGQQVMVREPADWNGRFALFKRLADEGEVELTARIQLDGKDRGLFYIGEDVFQTDRAQETFHLENLTDLVAPERPMVCTVAPRGSGTRIAIDRDGDGMYDHDESTASAGGDDANPFSPTNPDAAGNDGSLVADSIPDGDNDFDGDGIPNAEEFRFGRSPIYAEEWADVDASGEIDARDIQLAVNALLGVYTGFFRVDVNGDGQLLAGDLQQVINAALVDMPQLGDSLLARRSFPVFD